MERKLLLRNGAFRPWAIAAMLLLPPLIAVFCCGFGRMSLPPAKLIETAFLTLTGRDADPQARAVIFELRIPRILMAIAVGGGLGCAGAACQALFSNPLATPDILGVTSGTCVGAILAIILSFNMAGIQATALLFGLFSVFVTLRLSSGKRGISILFLVLSGVMISSLFNALSSLLKYTADPMDKLPQITYWLMGSFTGASYRKLLIGSPMILIGTALIYLLRWQFNILSLSEDEARASGIHLKRMRILLVLAITMITASSVSMCGQVGWVGLLIPHCARMMTGSNNRLVIPMSISLGASFLILIDTLSRTLTVIELPLSVLTAILGAPFFILLLKRSERSFR
ncbi:iron chelate uptake ABC transporter, FeCT family, permease protein [Oribacterium sp. oral taxon 078 str. F0262]|uniref:FecCD family ABC transporter permease n=1 Tax=Oribacterium sp. oral taxon 078 TaxID=652706 RepID=UPI0001BCB8E4|nr:iron ABC transporter permease [Oribacterium sp. oral taxon 078]EFE92816.1 iron chelate uptake ABC transporter, FeCT family, permease protein [Oribacterium sp. oral taxon 078 str. F0262]